MAERVSHNQAWVKGFRASVRTSTSEGWWVREHRGRMRLEVKAADGRMTSNTSGRERDSGDDSSGVSNGNLLARALDTSSSGSKHMDAWAREDSMTASFQVDRTGLITDDTLEIDVAKLHKGSSASREEPQQSKSDPAAKVVSEKHHGDGKVERLFADGKKLLIFSNGTRE